MFSTVRVQEKGQVTIPGNIRRRLKLKKGDLITIIPTEDGVVIKSLDLAADDLLNSLRDSLLQRNLSLDAILEQSQKISYETLIRKFGLSNNEKKILYQALQFKAQLATEEIRITAKNVRLNELTEEEIEAEIKEVRFGKIF